MRSFESVRSLALVSDTHGLLRESVKVALDGVGLIVHAGDLGSRRIVEDLERIAPLVAVCGNVDADLASLPRTELVTVNGRLLYVLHDLATLDLVPERAGIWMVVSGHSHKASIKRTNGVYYVNPGSVGPRRFRLPITYATVIFEAEEPVVSMVELEE